MNNFKPICCNNNECDFWNDNKCLYGGTGEITPNPENESDCKSFEPFNEEDEENNCCTCRYYSGSCDLNGSGCRTALLEFYERR
uniref:hypothetical protein n=1 Tax=Clostridium sp. 12(A) TaxID=1163671 RepID=UPI00046350A4|nr:hypothetical protein [Clostridium sp. 12(A)]